MSFDAPSPRYLGPAAHSTPGNNKPIRRIVIHSTVSPCREGEAEAVAAYFRTRAAGGSAHYVVDPGEVVQVVLDGVIAWHAPPNQGSLGIELCDLPDAASDERWSDEPHRRMLARAATLVAELCLAYDVPVHYAGVEELTLGMGGITTHHDVSHAFHESTHWDPGAWPREEFMSQVRAEVSRLQLVPQR